MMMMMMTTNPEYIVTDDLGLAKSSVAVSSEHGNHYVVDVEENFEAFKTGLEFKTSLVEVVE